MFTSWYECRCTSVLEIHIRAMPLVCRLCDRIAHNVTASKDLIAQKLLSQALKLGFGIFEARSHRIAGNGFIGSLYCQGWPLLIKVPRQPHDKLIISSISFNPIFALGSYSARSKTYTLLHYACYISTPLFLAIWELDRLILSSSSQYQHCTKHTRL